MEHLADEFDPGRLVRVLLLEVHDKPECAILEGCISRADDYGVPG